MNIRVYVIRKYFLVVILLPMEYLTSRRIITLDTWSMFLFWLRQSSADEAIRIRSVNRTTKFRSCIMSRGVNGTYSDGLFWTVAKTCMSRVYASAKCRSLRNAPVHIPDKAIVFTTTQCCSTLLFLPRLIVVIPQHREHHVHSPVPKVDSWGTHQLMSPPRPSYICVGSPRPWSSRGGVTRA